LLNGRSCKVSGIKEPVKYFLGHLLSMDEKPQVFTIEEVNKIIQETKKTNRLLGSIHKKNNYFYYSFNNPSNYRILRL